MSGSSLVNLSTRLSGPSPRIHAFFFRQCIPVHQLPAGTPAPRNEKRKYPHSSNYWHRLKDFDLWHWHGHSVGDETCFTALPVPRQNPSSSSLYRCWRWGQSLCRALVLGRQGHNMSDAHDLPHPNNNNMLITAVLMFHRYKLMEFLFVFGSIFLGKGGGFPVFWCLSLLLFVCLFWSLFLPICIYLCIYLSLGLFVYPSCPHLSLSPPPLLAVFISLTMHLH